MTFDQKAENTLLNLNNLLSVNYNTKQDIICPYSVGAEIEIKFKYLFPEIFKEYFQEKQYYDYDFSVQKIITEKINIVEEDIKKLLEATVEAGVPKGNDKYWEFSFNPVNNLTLLYYQIEILQKANLIPAGEHSIHLSVGGLKDTKDLYYILMILEHLFVKKERIQKGFSKDMLTSAFWAKKGEGGIFKKGSYDLIDAEVGFEYRTLFLYPDTDIYKLFQTLNYFLNIINRNHKSEVIESVKENMLRLGLPDKNWGKPHNEPEIWNRYINNFDEMASYTKTLIASCDIYNG